jgi:hypothetical protein
MWTMIGTCVALPTLMLAWFKKKDWL